MTLLQTSLKTTLIGMCLVGTAAAQEVVVSSDITTSTTWTSDKTYNLQGQIYVRDGATLTIQAGTVVASDTVIGSGGGSLAVTRGSRIMAMGTAQNPVIMTSKSDVATWAADVTHPTGKNPKTGIWREAANEWGNLTVMGSGYANTCRTTGNLPFPDAGNEAEMEGLTPAFAGDPNTRYGGGNDDDNSGVINYLSIRYGGQVLGLGNELNGLSLGAIGRDTDINFVEIMNNVDDGIEIWGGTVNVRHFAIWNIGDDSFDVDQGWRGSAQFGLIVQGYSLDNSQGSGVGDNGFESDGAEGSDWQPVTTVTIENCTFIGQPFDGDHATAWRDNARVQFNRCIFMDTGDEVVRFDDLGDHNCMTGGAKGYGVNGTLTWAQTWSTAYTQTSTVNPNPDPSVQAALYQGQIAGRLAQMTDSVFFNNVGQNSYLQAIAVNVFDAANNNVQEPANMPIQGLTRGTPVIRGGKAMVPVATLDPRPAADALASASFTNDPSGLLSGAAYRGAFAPGNNWLCGWTASTAFGFTSNDGFCDLGSALAGESGDPVLSGSGPLAGGQPIRLSLSNAKRLSGASLLIGLRQINAPLFGGTIVPLPLIVFTVQTSGAGRFTINFPWPNGVPAGVPTYFQMGVVDAAAPQGLALSNGLSVTQP